MTDVPKPPKVDNPRGPLEQVCLKNFLIRCCYHYYVLCDPIISDYEFDMEFKRLQGLEAEHGADADSPTEIIWGSLAEQYPEWVKEKEDDRMTE